MWLVRWDFWKSRLLKNYSFLPLFTDTGWVSFNWRFSYVLESQKNIFKPVTWKWKLFWILKHHLWVICRLIIADFGRSFPQSTLQKTLQNSFPKRYATHFVRKSFELFVILCHTAMHAACCCTVMHTTIFHPVFKVHAGLGVRRTTVYGHFMSFKYR